MGVNPPESVPRAGVSYRSDLLSFKLSCRLSQIIALSKGTAILKGC